MSVKLCDFPNFLASAVLVVPLLLCFWFVFAYGTNLPYQDDWAFIFEARQFLLHETSILSLLNHQHNDHRMGIPYLFLLGIGLCSGWNWVSMMQANAVVLSFTNLVLFAWSWARFKPLHLHLLILLPISLVMCSFRQWENLLFAFQACIYLVNLFFLFSLILLERSKGVDWKFALAIFAALCACNCNGNGLLVLPLGLLAMILQWAIVPGANNDGSAPLERKFLKRKMLIWLAVSPAAVIWFFHSYLPQGFFRFKTQYWSENPLGTIKFFFGTFGALFANDIDNAAKWGVFFIATTLLTLFSCCKRRTLDRFAISAWMIVLFGLSFDLLVFLGRAGLALDRSISKGEPEDFLNAICSRYATTNSLTLVGLYLLVIWSYRRGWLTVINAAFVSALITCCIYVSLTIGIPTAEVWHDLRLTEKSILENQELVSETSLKRIYPFVDCMHKFRTSIESLGIVRCQKEAFPSQRPCMKEATAVITYINGNLDNTGKWALTRKSDVMIKGWALDERARAPAKAVWIAVDGKPFIRAAYGLNRPEIVSFCNRLKIGHTGFAAVFSPGQIGSGRHEISLKVISSDGLRCMDSGLAAVVDVP